METSASFEARYAPSLYPTGPRFQGPEGRLPGVLCGPPARRVTARRNPLPRMCQVGREARKLAHRATDKRLCIFRDFARKSLRARSALECGPASRDRFCGSSFLGVLPEASFRRRKAVPQAGPHSKGHRSGLGQSKKGILQN